MKSAVAYSLKHDIPFLPELPLRGDGILEYIKNPGQLSCLKEFKKYTFEIVKVQCVGPATLVISGYSAEDAIDRIYLHIFGVLGGLKASQVILFLDEPALGQAGFHFERLWALIFESFRVTPGVHCCGNMDWDILFESKLIEIISFDASQYDLTRYPKYKDFREKGGKIAWGVQKKEDVKDFRQGDLITLPCGIGTKLYAVKDCKRELKKLIKIAEQIKE